MTQKEPQKKIYKTANGQVIDLDLLKQQNELTPAVGNAKVNARGDLLGPGGDIVKTRDEVLRDFYAVAEGKASRVKPEQAEE